MKKMFFILSLIFSFGYDLRAQKADTMNQTNIHKSYFCHQYKASLYVILPSVIESYYIYE